MTALEHAAGLPDALAAYLIDQGFGVGGESLWVGEAPAEAASGLLLNAGGDWKKPTLRPAAAFPLIQVVSFGPDYEAARAAAQAVSICLHGLGPVRFPGGVSVGRITADGAPFPIQRDAGRWRFVCNYSATI